ncbi:DUF5615 family PIN-like protein [Desulfococcaceae bacterium HSG8]|nr:DUF5615 family PIN-like protein [Desulfococcaceae bacterium HSG8]
MQERVFNFRKMISILSRFRWIAKFSEEYQRKLAVKTEAKDAGKKSCMKNRIKFYLDEHVSKAVAKGLRRRGIDVITVVEAGLLGETDEEHLERAKSERRTIFTQDDDFLRLHAASNEHAGIVYNTDLSLIHPKTLSDREEKT